MNRLTIVSVLVLAACGSKPAPTTSPAPAADDRVAVQIEAGKQLYVEHCAACHGASGEGSDQAPAVVGKDAFPRVPRPGAKRQTEFRTAADVFAFASANMPPTAPGSLTTEQYLAIFAFDLTANGVTLTAPLDAAAAAAIVLHP